jgi:hypothetical protein
MMDRKTIFSPDRVYRYVLWREWGPRYDKYAMFIGLNPSTADETTDDPTVRRCVGFAKAWGYAALCMTNLFAYRSTDPAIMMCQPSPVGPFNDWYLTECARDAGVIVAAWGTHGRHAERDRQVQNLLTCLKCLGVTKDGSPRHPLYVKGSTVLVEYDGQV